MTLPELIARLEKETCATCQGNGEIVTDWERYLHPMAGDTGDEAVAECPDCDGEGQVAEVPGCAALRARSAQEAGG